MQKEQVATTPKPTDSDIKEFLRSLLGGRCFRKTYHLYDGELAVSFKTLSTKEERALHTVCEKVPKDKDRLARIVGIRLAFHIVSIDSKLFNFNLDELKVLERCEHLYQKNFPNAYSPAMLAILIRTLAIFKQLREGLIEKAFDANFCKGAGLS